MSEFDGNTRERLIAGAITLLEEGGEAAVRVETVSVLAGVARPSLYHFFGDRDGLVIAAQATRYRDSLLVNMESQTEATRNCKSREEFIQLVREYMKSLSSPEGEHRRRVRTEVLGSSVARPTLRAQITEANQMLSRQLGALLQIAKDRGWLTLSFDLDVAATWWFGMMNGRFLVEGDVPTIFRREWDDIALRSIECLLFGDDID